MSNFNLVKIRIDNFTNWILAALMIIFGLNKFIGFIAVAPPADPVAQQFMGAMFSSYLFAIVAITEIIGSIFLIIPKMRFAGWLILSPVILNIVLFHFAHDFVGNGIWLVPTLLFGVLSFFNLSKIKSLINN